MRKDAHNNLEIVPIINSAVISGAAGNVNSDAGADMQGFTACELVANVGESGDTLSGSLKLELIIMHGDLANLSDQAPVDDADIVLADTFDELTGIFAIIDAAAEDDAVYKCGYVGPKQYVTMRVKKTGTHTNGTPVGAVAIMGGAHRVPV